MWFQCVGPLMPPCNTYRLGFLLPWTRGISSPPPLLTSNVKQLLSALLRPRSHHSLDVGLLLSAAAPDLGLWGSSSLRCLCAAAAAGACGLSDSGGVGDALSPAQEGGPGEVGGAPSHLVLRGVWRRACQEPRPGRRGEGGAGWWPGLRLTLFPLVSATCLESLEPVSRLNGF